MAGVRPSVEEFPLEEAATAFDRMMSSTVHFRAVLRPTPEESHEGDRHA
jgi:propanol-preferring alcohol dehydrogenase